MRRADRAVLAEVLTGVLTASQVDRMEQFRRGHPTCSVMQALASLQLSRDQIRSASRLLAASSDTFSLWVQAEGSARSWYRLYVQRPGAQAEEPIIYTFNW
jgi:hypothetical protein